jgi:GNAT superfamily N-acetyltransferase
MKQRAPAESPLRIRPLGHADLTVARRLLGDLGYAVADGELERRIARVADSAGHLALVAEQHDDVVGLLHAFERPALEKPCEVIVQALVVDPKVRGRGIGKALMGAAEGWAATRGQPSVALHTRNAQGYYTHLGYAKVASSDLMRKAIPKGAGTP